MNYPKPPFPEQPQPMPGITDAMTPVPDHGETSYKGSGRLAGKKAVITGGDSGIGRAVAIAYAREGADVLISYLSEDGDARKTARHVEEAGRKAILMAGDLQSAGHCRAVVAVRVRRHRHPRQQRRAPGFVQVDRGDFGRGMGVDLQGQYPREVLPDQGRSPPHEAWELHHQYGVDQFRRPQSDAAGLRYDQGRDIQLHCRTGADAGRERPGQPVELATAYVMLADPLSSYVSGANIAVTGGRPFL